MEDFEERLKVLEEQAARPAERNYNFFRPVGQFIEHVDTINFSMNKEGTFRFEKYWDCQHEQSSQTRKRRREAR